MKSVFQELETSENGINANSVDARIEKFGKNELEKQKKNGFFKKLFAQFKNIMIIILLISAIISEVSAIVEKNYENVFEGILIFSIVLINAIVGVIQEQKAEDALAALAKSSEPFAKVIRNGSLVKIKVSDVVVGDVVCLKAGDSVPADLRIFECNNLKTNESSLTGESHSVSKNAKTINKNSLPLADQENICFAGTTVTAGSAKGVVTAVGMNAEMGKIAKILGSSIKEKTPLEKNIDKIGKVITFGVLGITFVVFLVQVLLSKNVSVLQALLTAVALAVAAIPESLPAVITIIMALGVQKLARKNVIIKKLSAVETLGCCTVICSDKTGTLTKNEMSVKHFFVGENVESIENLNSQKLQGIFEAGALCNTARIEKDGKIVADATETAIIKFLQNQNVDINVIKSKNTILKLGEFNSIKKSMSVVCENAGTITLYIKGALDYIIGQCKFAQVGGETLPMTDKLSRKILIANEKVCEMGERVIAFAKKISDNLSDESDLVFVGFLGIIDPPRPEVKQSIKQCKKAGLQTVMITGDHPSTAFAIAQSLGIASSKKEVMTGSEIAKLSEKELAKIVGNYHVFARVTPEHKLLLVKALKSNGNIVAMTGDGVNDAPSIKSANIGACMGITGTDVTKEVSDMLISDDNFATIVVAIKEGRTIYQNIEKTILFLLSTNIVEVLGIFVTSLIMPNAVFLLPAQILFINLVTDSLPAFALGIEPSEPNIMDKPPRDPKSSLLSGWVGSSIIYQGFVQSLIVLVMFVCARNFYGNDVASTMSFVTICLMQIIHAINCKTEKSIFKINIFKNKFFNFSFVLLLAMILAVCFVPALASMFGLVTLSSTQWLIVTATSIAIIPLVEIGKIFIK